MEGIGSSVRQPGQVRKKAAVTNQPEVGVPPPFYKQSELWQKKKNKITT